MTRLRSAIRATLGLLAGGQVVLVVLLAPVLVFPDRFSPVTVSLALAAIPVLWVLHKLARGCFFTPTPADLSLLLLLAVLPVGLWVSPLPAETLPHLIKTLIAVALYFALVNLAAVTVGRAGFPRLAGWALLASTAVVAVVGPLGMAWSGGKLPFLPTDLAQRVPRLIQAFWNPQGFHPNIVGGALAMLVPVTAAYVWMARPWWLRILLLPLLVGEAGALVLTQSRGGLLGFGVALMVVVIAGTRLPRPYWRWAWMLPVALLLGAAAVGRYGVQPTLELIWGGVGQSAVGSLDSRVQLVMRGVYILQDFPFTGIGPGMFPKVMPLLYPLYLPDLSVEVPHVHNIYLQMGVDHGFPGLVAFLAFLIGLATMGVQAIRAGRVQPRAAAEAPPAGPVQRFPWEPLPVGLLAGLAAYAVHGLVDSTGYTPRAHILTWGFFGLIAAVWHWTVVVRRHAAGPGDEQ